MMSKRLTLLIGALALVAVACGGAAVDAGNAAPSPADNAGSSPSTTTPIAVDPPTDDSGGLSLPDGPSALVNAGDPAFPEPLVDLNDIISGGPPPDGIPPIDRPSFVSVDEADEYLADAEPVIWLDVNGDVRAYPVQILIWHEIVNDRVGDVPLAITYCPLCNSAVTYVREIRGVETTFGTSGRLFASALVMYDRATESLWTHFDGTAVAGVLTGERLQPVSTPLLAWGDFKAAHPEAQVLDRDATGFDRPYGAGPYTGYDNPDSTPFLFIGDADDRLREKERVAGVAINDETRAYTFEFLSGGDANIYHDELGGTDIVLFWKAGQASALDTSNISEGRDVGSVAVFDTTIGDRKLTFRTEGDRFFDNETDSEWLITGESIAGELDGSKLTQIHHLDTFWFAWSTYQPGTELIES